MVSTTPHRIDRVDLWLLAMAAVWGVALVLAAFFVPAYSSSGTSSSGPLGGSSASLVQQNGLRVLLPVAAPLVAVGIVGILIRRRRREELPGAGIASWVIVGILGGISILGILSIGVLILPVAALLLAVCLHAR